MEKQVDFGKKRMEQELSSIGAKVADAVDCAEEIERMSGIQEKQLLAAQTQLSNLYETMGEALVAVPPKAEEADAADAKDDEDNQPEPDGTDG